MPKYGVIDLGSNSIRLVIYSVKDNASKPFSKKDFRSIINEKKIAGLSAYVVDGVFTEDGVRKAVDILGEHLRRARNFDCADIRIFATAVLRNCANSKEATAAISEGIDFPIEMISARDEAHLGFIGATCDRRIESGTLIDIGGGSTELTVIEDGADTLNISLDQGSVSSYAEFVEMILPTVDEMRAIEAAFKTRLATVEDTRRLPHPEALRHRRQRARGRQALRRGVRRGRPPQASRTPSARCGRHAARAQPEHVRSPSGESGSRASPHRHPRLPYRLDAHARARRRPA